MPSSWYTAMIISCTKHWSKEISKQPPISNFRPLPFATWALSTSQASTNQMFWISTFQSTHFNTSEPYYSALHEKRNDSWLTRTQFDKNIAYYIEFGGVRLSTQSYIKYRVTNTGMCLSFNGPSQNPPLVSKMAGSRRGLTIFAYIDQDNYILAENMGAGLKVSIIRPECFRIKSKIDNKMIVLNKNSIFK